MFNKADFCLGLVSLSPISEKYVKILPLFMEYLKIHWAGKRQKMSVTLQTRNYGGGWNPGFFPLTSALTIRLHLHLLCGSMMLQLFHGKWQVQLVGLRVPSPLNNIEPGG